MVASAARYAPAVELGYLALDAYPSAVRWPSCAAAVLAVASLLVAGGAGGATDAPEVASGWLGLLGSRPAPELGGRWVVVLRAPSVADRVLRAGGTATDSRCAWTSAAEVAQRRAIAGLWSRGTPVHPEQTYLRVLNGFARRSTRRSSPGWSAIPRLPACTRFGRRIRRRPCRRVGHGGVRRAERPSGRDRHARARRNGRRDRSARHGRRCASPLPPGAPAARDRRRGRRRRPHGEPNRPEPGRPERHATGLAGLMVGVEAPPAFAASRRARRSCRYA